MVYASKAQQQAELAELSEVLLVAAFDTMDDEDGQADTDEEEEWLSELDDQDDEVSGAGNYCSASIRICDINIWRWFARPLRWNTSLKRLLMQVVMRRN